MDERQSLHLEDWRQLEHLLPLGFAFLLPYISLVTAIGLCGLAILYALVISPRLIRITTREDEKRRGFSIGKLSYALCVLALLLIFSDRLYIAAATWALLAVGDATSNIVGRRWGHSPLFYNPSKTVTGTLTFWVSGAIAALILLLWSLPEQNSLPWSHLTLVSFIAAFFAAVAESLPIPVDDNVIICWVGGSVLHVLFSLEPLAFQPASSWFAAIVLNLAVAAIAIWLRWISFTGIAVAFVFGTIVYSALGPGGYLAILLFLAVGSMSTRLGQRHKQILKVAEGKSGRRGVLNVLSNGLVPILLAVAGYWLKTPVLAVAYCAAVATAALDTTATEIGQWLGRSPRTLPNLKIVPVGTPGAVSMTGLIAGVGAAALIALPPWSLGFVPSIAVPVIILAALTGGLVESYLGGRFVQNHAYRDEILNLFNTFIGAFTGWVVWSLF